MLSSGHNLIINIVNGNYARAKGLNENQILIINHCLSPLPPNPFLNPPNSLRQVYPTPSLHLPSLNYILVQKKASKWIGGALRLSRYIPGEERASGLAVLQLDAKVQKLVIDCKVTVTHQPSADLHLNCFLNLYQVSLFLKCKEDEASHSLVPSKRNPKLKSPRPQNSSRTLPSDLRTRPPAVTFQQEKKIPQEYSPQINDSEEKGLISKTLDSGKKFKHANQDYLKFLDVGKNFLRDANLPSSIDCFNKAISLDPHQVQAHYLLAVAYLADGQFSLSQGIFQFLLKRPNAKKNVYLLLAACYKKIGRQQLIQKLLSQCLQKFPKFYDAYTYRAKIRVKFKFYQEAFRDFDIATQLNPSKIQGHIGKADTLRLLNRHKEAIQILSKIPEDKKTQTVFLKQSLCLLQLQMFDEAMRLVNHALGKNKTNSEGLFLRGLIYQRMRRFEQALLEYQQAIALFSNKKAVAKSFYQIMKIQIQQRQFYQAWHTVNRIGLYQLQERTLAKFRSFLEGTLIMRKKETLQALAHFQQFQQNFKVGDFLKPFLLSFKASAHIYLGKYQQAYDDLLTIENQFSLDNQNAYNKYICAGIISSNNNKYQQALTNFTRAIKVAPQRHQPLFYKAMTLMKFSNRFIPANQHSKKEKYTGAVLKNLDKAILINSKCYNMFYHRAVIYSWIGRVDESFKDISKSLKLASNQEVSIVKLLYLRALLHSHAGDLCKAIDDFSRVISEDKKKDWPQAYLNRAKCLLFYGDKDSALSDLQTYMVSSPSDPNIHVWAGIILFHIKSYQESIKAYSNITNIKKNQVVLKLRADAYLASKQIKSCIIDLNYLLQLTPKDRDRIEVDVMVLQAIKESMVCDQSHLQSGLKLIREALKRQKHGLYFNTQSMLFYQSLFLFFLGEFEKALQAMAASKDSVRSSDKKSWLFTQMKFNLAVCYIVCNKLNQAIPLLDEVLKDAPPRCQQQQIRFLREAAVKSLEKRAPNNQDQQDQVQIQLFSNPKRLCNVFPLIPLPLSVRILAKFSFCLPEPDPPTFPPEFQMKLIEQMNPLSVEPVPQVPWVNKSLEGITFTEYMVKQDYIQQSQECSNIDEEEASEAMQLQMEEEGHISMQEISREQLPQRGNLLQFLRLDDGVQAKINKIMKNRKES